MLSKNLKSNEFIDNLDRDIRRTEESLKEMNDRFQKIRQSSSSPMTKQKIRDALAMISPIKKDATPGKDTSGNKTDPTVPIFEASLFKGSDQSFCKPSQPSSIPNHKSRNLSYIGDKQTTSSSSTSNMKQIHQSFDQQRERPLLYLKIKINSQFISANVYKDDTSSSVADRILRHIAVKPSGSF